MRDPSADPSPLRIHVYRYGDLEPTAALCARAGLTPLQAASLRAHPYARPEDAAVLVLLRGEETMGRFGLIPGRMRIGEREFRLSWSSDWYARDRRNRAGGALLLLQALREAGSLGSCGLSSIARQVLAAARFDIVPLPRRVFVLRSEPFWRQHVAAPVARALGVPSDVLLRLARTGSRLRTSGWRRSFTLEQVERFGAPVDEVERASRGACWFPRDHRELNWALELPWFAPPARDRYRAFHLRATGSATIAGYALARVHSYGAVVVGSLLRSAVRPEAAGGVEALVALTLEALGDDGVHLVDICTSNRPLLGAAARAGMLAHGHVELACRFAAAPADALRALGAALGDFEADMGEGDMLFA